MTQQQSPPTGPVTPVGLNHLVLNVRDLEESHRFWTEILGFKQVGERKATPERANPPRMRFYSGDHDGKMQHHDIALIVKFLHTLTGEYQGRPLTSGAERAGP